MTRIAILDGDIQSMFSGIQCIVDPSSCTAPVLKHFILEHSCFSRRNPSLLRAAAENTGEVQALSAELRRNFDEEVGKEGQDAHFKLYCTGLMESFGLAVSMHQERPETSLFLHKLSELANSGCASIVCGAFYATEAGAIPELEFVQSLTEFYADRRQQSCLPQLVEFYDLHLGGVEQGHKDGLGALVDECEAHGLDFHLIRVGFYSALAAMNTWWQALAAMMSSPRPIR